MMNPEEGKTPVTSVAESKSRVSVKEIVSSYLLLKNALVNDNPGDAADAGKAVEAAFKNFKRTTLTADQKKVFEDLENAIQFQDRFIPVFSRIFIGEGTNIQHDGGAIRLSIYDTEVNKELVIDFWKEYPRLGYLIHVPKGTVFCDSFTPERIVHP